MHSPDTNGDISRLVFVYGTLMRGYKLHQYLERDGATYIGKGRIRARLFDLPDEGFPGAIPDPNSYTLGELYSLKNSHETLLQLDQLEGCDEGLFERELVDVWRNASRQKAWTYFYKRPLNGAREIPAGDYRQIPA
jgi:gamma-glutamylcyclotransferase (GGCT)/AIG2-like uncharacterized protein YtfP